MLANLKRHGKAKISLRKIKRKDFMEQPDTKLTTAVPVF